MKTIDNIYTHEVIIKNSRFVAILYPLKNILEIKKYLDEVKINYPKATHYTYAYIFDNQKKSSDDNEPSGTAGIPMLSILENNDLNKILVVNVRYFGGIKLGTGGLVRAYSKSLKMVLEKASIKELVQGYLVEITFSYNDQNKISNLLKDMTILQKKFLEEIKYLIEVPKDKLQLLEKYNYKVLKEIDIIK